MKDATRDSLIVTLAEMFVGKRVSSEVVTQALELICKEFSFEIGLVYELNQYNEMQQKEYSNRKGLPSRSGFFLDDLNEPSRKDFSHQLATYLHTHPSALDWQRETLEYFHASSLVAVSLVDEQYFVYGLIMVVNQKAHQQLSECNLRSLTLMLSMVSRYVGIRVSENKQSFARMSLEGILDNTGIDIYVNDFYNHDVLYVNKSMAAPYGGISQFHGKKCWQVLFPGQGGPCEFCPQKKLIDEKGEPSKIYTWDYRRNFDGSWFRVFSAAFRWVDGRLAHVVSSADITDNKKNEELIQYMANYDSLTSLPNRRMLISQCEQMIQEAKERQKAFLLFFDLDGFKAINDRLGHDAGDEFLVLLGQFFMGLPLLKDRVYRNGGDEFVALLGNGVTEEQVRMMTAIIHQRFEDPWELKKGQVYCNVSVGVSLYPQDGETADQLLYMADQAMYHVKKSGGGGLCFSFELETGESKLEIPKDL